MRKNRSLFFDSLIACLISWGIPRYWLKSADKEAFLLLGLILTLICTAILLPLALRVVKNDTPPRAGFYLPLMILPLLIIISYPSFALTPLSPFYLGLDLLPHHQWILNSGVNFLLIGIIAMFYTLISKGHQASWPGSILTSLLILTFYAAAFYINPLL